MLILLVVLILLNGVLAMAELAVVASRPARLQARGDRGALEALRLVEEPSRFLATSQIGITLVGVVLGAVGQAGIVLPVAAVLKRIPALAARAEVIATLLVVGAITYCSLVLGELVPKRLAMRWPEAIARVVARPMLWLARLSAPLVWLLSASTDLVSRLLGVRGEGEEPVSEAELKALAAQGVRTGTLKPTEGDLLDRLLRLDDRPIQQLMTPRQEVVWLDLADPPDDWQAVLTQHAFSYFPVGDGTLDRPVGMLKAKEALAAPGWPGEAALRACLREALMVPEGLTALALLERFRGEQTRQALILDEHGGVEGLVTLHDLMEAMVGELPDDTGPDDPEVVQRADGSWLIDGRLGVDELREILGAETLPDEEHYHTAAGFVLHLAGTVPSKGDSYDWNGFRLEVVDLDGRRVDQLLVTRLVSEAEG